MILQKEIRKKSENIGVPPDTIDKDYVLGHFINHLFTEKWAQDNLLFKGGTCLKKCYFEQYRFSEDIDLTIVNKEFLLSKEHLLVVCETVTKETGIVFKILKFQKCLHQNIEVGWDVEICFWGANHPKNDIPRFGEACHTKIWCELRSYEIVLSPMNLRPIFHNFSDAELIKTEIPCYDIHEILAEKLRALIQRNRGEARDYFDIWHIWKNIENIDWQLVKLLFHKKCAFKGIEFTKVDDFFNPHRLKQVDDTWNHRLQHQLPYKIDKKAVIDDLKNFLSILFF
jgi:predicted nucleotidyltransferase component of viral defense system